MESSWSKALPHLFVKICRNLRIIRRKGNFQQKSVTTKYNQRFRTPDLIETDSIYRILASAPYPIFYLVFLQYNKIIVFKYLRWLNIHDTLICPNAELLLTGKFALPWLILINYFWLSKVFENRLEDTTENTRLRKISQGHTKRCAAAYFLLCFLKLESTWPRIFVMFYILSSFCAYLILVLRINSLVETHNPISVSISMEIYFHSVNAASKVSVFGVFLVRIFRISTESWDILCKSPY